jgi:hypothetical protein
MLLAFQPRHRLVDFTEYLRGDPPFSEIVIVAT